MMKTKITTTITTTTAVRFTGLIYSGFKDFNDFAFAAVNIRIETTLISYLTGEGKGKSSYIRGRKKGEKPEREMGRRSRIHNIGLNKKRDAMV